MTDTEIKASHLEADNSYGQNGSPQSASLTPGQTKPNIPNVSPPSAKVSGLDEADTLNHRIKGNAVPTHRAMDGRPKNSGSPSGRVPAATLRRDSGKKLLGS